jgi:hypothetical protein
VLIHLGHQVYNPLGFLAIPLHAWSRKHVAKHEGMSSHQLAVTGPVHLTISWVSYCVGTSVLLNEVQGPYSLLCFLRLRHG